jgi:mono/diheme cytochrome c family protein
MHITQLLKSMEIYMKTIILSAVFGLIIGALVIWFGAYNVAANDRHFSSTETFLEFVRNRSISVRSEDIQIPELENNEVIKKGAQFYAEMCTGCHLAPGMEQTELNAGLYPQPPVFSQSDYKNNPAAQFWVIKNGLKMTGMPAWSPSHTDEQIWTMVAFINQLKLMSPEQYEMLAQETEGGGEHHDAGHSH